MKKIALFHPWIKSKGGAEKVVLKLAKELNASVDIYTWIYDKEKTFPEFKDLNIKILSPNFAKKLSRAHILRGLFLFLSIFSKIPLKKYDKFLISTSGVGEFITFRNYKKDQTYAYVHTPLREANKKIMGWNLKNRNYNFMQKVFYLLAVRIYKIFEKLSWKRLDYIVFNSELSKQRAIESNLLKNKKNIIIYPPIDLPHKNGLTKTSDYFLYVSRINPPKRQLELLMAWKEFNKKFPKYKIILIGSGENKKYFEKIQELIKKSKNAELKSNLEKGEIEKLYSNCLAGLFLGYQEDFGIVPLEIVNYGKPLIAVNQGGFVKTLGNFYKIKEKENSKDFINEIEKTLKQFVNSKKKIKTENKIKHKDFIKEMDKIIGENLK